MVHEGITKGVYAALRGASSALVKAGAVSIGAAADPDAPSIRERPVGRIAIGALNGAFGDRLRERRSRSQNNSRSAGVDGL